MGYTIPIINASVGDVSVGKGNAVNLGDKTGLSPYFLEFRGLLNCPGDFVTSI